ncbi:WbuC family cupin fold metalloprotein [Chromobacterium subtsugae]|uniref:WbuC family cupin fold metalloprotein n=1 Tax=Chromobacterium subtsugae TaxID=251747 RepID=UPI000A69CAEE|nr:WbuC family cupin fold metalloprotein [Chromobacterium subtsugae]
MLSIFYGAITTVPHVFGMCYYNGILQIVPQGTINVQTIKSKLISNDYIETVIEESKGVPRKRIPILVHDSYDEIPQRFVNCMASDSYIKPHKHESDNQWELVTWMSGEMLIVIFDDLGRILNKVKIGQRSNRIMEIQRNQYHSYVPLSDCAYLEIRNCRFVYGQPEVDRTFASWAPDEGSIEVNDFVAWLKRADIGKRYGQDG